MNTGKYLLVLLCILAMASCKKDKEDEVVKDFTMEALTTKSWRPALVDGNTRLIRRWVLTSIMLFRIGIKMM
jgi:hypothetical protein